MATERLFTEEELKEMGKLTIERIFEAIESGNKEKAKELAGQMHDEAITLLDRYMNWVADFMDFIYVNFGEEELEKAMRQHQGISEGRRIDKYKGMDFRSMIQAQAASLRGLLQKLEVKEDAEKVCIKMNPCGTGQRLLQSGVYDAPRNLSRMKPHRTTFNTDSFPVYCAHAAIQEMISIEKIGYPLYVHWFPAGMANESCSFCFYKDPKSIPDEVFERFGMKKTIK